MVKHSLLKEETAKAKEPVTKTRNKRYTKTRPKKPITEEATLPQPKWWQRNSIYRLLCCQNVCYSTILYIVLLILLAMFAFAVWRVCENYLISKSHIPLKGSHNWKNNTSNNDNNNDDDSETAEEGGSGHKKHSEGHHHKQNQFRNKLKELPHNTPGRTNHRKFQSNVLSKENLSHLKNHVPSPSITKHNNDHDLSSSDNPEDIPGDKRYVIPPSPTRLKASNGLDGSGASEVEQWRAIRYNLLRNRLQLTTGTSYPTENPYWKAWFLSRNNPSTERPFAGSGVFPVHDDSYKSISHLLESIPSVVVRNPQVKRPLVKHSDIQVVKKNTTIPNAYSKLLQDLFDKISAMRQMQTTVRQTKPNMATNTTLLQLKILSALVNKGIQFKPFDSSLRNVNAVGKIVTARPNIVAASNSTTRRLTTTPTTKTTTVPTTTTKATTTASTTASTTTKATTAVTTTARATTATKATSKATVLTTTLKDTTSGATTTTGRTTHKNAHSHRTHNRRKRRKFKKFSKEVTHGSIARHYVNHHHHHHQRHTSAGFKHHKKSSIKEPVSRLRAGTLDFGSGSDDVESGSGSSSGSGESGSGIEEPRIERRKDDGHKASGKNHQRLHKYIGLRERVKKLKHGKLFDGKLKKHNLHHGSNWAKKKGKEFIGKARDVIPKRRKSHKEEKKKTYHRRKTHQGHRPKRKNDSKKKIKKVRKSNKHKFMKIIQRKISRMKTKNQIASRLKHVQNKIKAVIKRKNKKKKSRRGQKRSKITRAERDQTKLLSKSIKRREEPKHWSKGHLSMKRCVILKEFDHHHYVGLTKLWRAGNKNTFALTECKRKREHSNRFRCRRTFYRTRGQMGLKSKRAEKRGRLSLIVCRKKHELKESLNNHSRQERKASINYSKEKKMHKKRKHRKTLKRSHRHKKKKHHDLQSSTKRNSISQQGKRKFHHHRKGLRRHRKSHHKLHKRRPRKKKRHKSIWSDTYDDGNDNDYEVDDSDDFSASDDDDDDDSSNGSGSGEDSSGDEEERVERSTNVSNLSHSRIHGKRNHHRRHTHHNHHHNRHHQHRRHIELKHSIGKANLTNETGFVSHDNNNNNSQIFTEFVDLMKEMKQEIQNVTALKVDTPSVKLKESIANSSHPTIKTSQLSNQTTQIHSHTSTPTPRGSVKNTSAINSSLNSAINPGMVHDMVAQLVPAIMKQFEAKSMLIPTKGTKDTTITSSTSSNEKSGSATTKSVHGNTTSKTTAKITTKVMLKTTRLPTALKTTKAHPTPHPTNRHPTTPKHVTVTHHHSTRRKSQLHPKTTAAPNLALIIKGLKALGIPSIGQHVSTGKPSQVQKKSVTPSAVDKSKSTLKTAPAPPKQPQLPPPIPKPLQLHNRFLMNILCFGDSLTAGYHDHGKAFTPYGNHLRQLLTYSSKIPVNLKIKGIVGEMTHKQMVSRLPEILGNNTAFDWVIILGGTNDILHVKNFADDQEFLGQLESVWQPRITKDIEKLHTIAHNHNAHTMLLTIPENAIESWPGYKILLTMRTKINDALRKYANENRNNIALCDLAKKLPRHSLSPQQEALFWDDHLHMTPQGYNRMAEEVFKCLKPYVPQNPTMI